MPARRNREVRVYLPADAYAAVCGEVERTASSVSDFCRRAVLVAVAAPGSEEALLSERARYGMALEAIVMSQAANPDHLRALAKRALGAAA